MFFLSLLLQCKFANSTLLSLLSFSDFITPYDAQASSAFSALILTVTAQSNHFLHSKAINKHFQVETFRIGTPDISIEKYPEIE